MNTHKMHTHTHIKECIHTKPVTQSFARLNMHPLGKCLVCKDNADPPKIRARPFTKLQLALVAFGCPLVCGGRTYNRYVNIQTKYCNPPCTFVSRVNICGQRRKLYNYADRLFLPYLSETGEEISDNKDVFPVGK